jgi:subtilisin family serine protease
MLNFSIKTKRKLCISIAAAIVFTAFALAILFLCNNYSGEDLSSSQGDITEILNADDYSGITISKDSLNKLSYAEFMADNDVNEIYATNNDVILTEDNAKEELEELGYTVYSSGDSYNIYTQFYLKRLFVSGEYTQTYDAVNVYSYEGYDLLCYDSEEATSYAYDKLSSENGIEVFADSVLMLSDSSDTTTVTYSYDGYLSWGAEAMDVAPYLEYLETNGTDQDIAIVTLDTGVNTSHELLTNRFFYEDGKIVGSSVIETTYDYSGYKFEDDAGHGSHVAGIIAGLTPSNVKIIPIKVIGTQASSVAAVFQGLDLVLNVYASKYNIACINMSISSDSESYTKSRFDNYITSLRQKNILTVVAAGNEKMGSNYKLPAACKGALVVSALKMTKSGNTVKYSFDGSYSNYGPTIDFCAPGTEIYSSYISSTDKAGKNVYEYLSGTSMATPHVSAAVALVCLDSYYWSNGKPTYTADEIETTLQSYTVKLGGNNWDAYYGYGMISFASFEKKSDIDATYTLSAQSGTYGDEINLDKTAYTLKVADGVDVSGVEIELTTTATQTSSVGEYELTANIIKNPDDLKIKIVDSTYTISKRLISLGVDDQSGEYGTKPVLDQTKYYTKSGSIVSGDEKFITLTTDATGNKVGRYVIHVYFTNSNYSVYTDTGIYTVKPRSLTLELQPQTSTYGDNVSLNNSLYEVKDGTVLTGDKLGITLATTASKTSNVGEYPITIAKYTNNNYSIAYVAGVYTIQQRNIVVKLSDQTIDLSEDQTISQTDYEIIAGGYDGLKLNTLTIKTAESTYEAGNTYELLGEQTDANFNVTFVTGQLSVIKTKSDIGTDQSASAENTGNENGDNSNSQQDNNQTTENNGESSDNTSGGNSSDNNQNGTDEKENQVGNNNNSTDNNSSGSSDNSSTNTPGDGNQSSDSMLNEAESNAVKVLIVVVVTLAVLGGGTIIIYMLLTRHSS